MYSRAESFSHWEHLLKPTASLSKLIPPCFYYWTNLGRFGVWFLNPRWFLNPGPYGSCLWEFFTPKRTLFNAAPPLWPHPSAPPYASTWLPSPFDCCCPSQFFFLLHCLIQLSSISLSLSIMRKGPFGPGWGYAFRKMGRGSEGGNARTGG